MKAFMKKICSYLIIFVIGVVLGCLTRCNGSNEQSVRTDVVMVSDSLKTASMEAKINELDSSIKMKDREIDSIKNKANKSIHTYNKAKKASINKDSIIVLADTAIYNIQKEADLLADKIEITESKIEAKDSIISIKQITIDSLSDDIIILNKEIKKNNNWWNRNKFWIGFGSAIVVSGITGALLTRR